MHLEVSQPSIPEVGPYRFFVWKGLQIVASGYQFQSAIEAANAGSKALAELREARRIARRQRWPFYLLHEGQST